ncbi:MAG: hypothetical protein WAS21_17035 [Geminicoccaceae bacterium]
MAASNRVRELDAIAALGRTAHGVREPAITLGDGMKAGIFPV